MADPLHAYLNDHLGGATTGRDLARTLAERLAPSATPSVASPGSGGPDHLGELRAFEMLCVGVEGKCCLWEGLRTLSGSVPPLRGTDYDDLLARARAQRAWLEEQRLAATGRVGGAAGA